MIAKGQKVELVCGQHQYAVNALVNDPTTKSICAAQIGLLVIYKEGRARNWEGNGLEEARVVRQVWV